MMRPFRPIASAAVATLFVGSPALATPEQDLYRAYQNLSNGRYLQARDGARAYLAANGPRFSAAFIMAVAECMLHPHQQGNGAPFRRLRVDYAVSPDKDRSITSWMSLCTSPPPVAQPQEAGVSGSAMTMRPSTEAGRPDPTAEPPSRLPKRPPPKPSVVGAMTSTGTMTSNAPIVAGSTVAVVARPADRCLQGFVWREAYAGDHVCVTPDVRRDAAYDNQQAAARRDPAGAYGPNSCIAGFVWRAARPDDLVCVTPDRRTQAVRDNDQAGARRMP